jgi:hypothetical protein
MELYSGPKVAHGKYEKTNVAGSIDRDSTVNKHVIVLVVGSASLQTSGYNPMIPGQSMLCVMMSL